MTGLLRVCVICLNGQSPVDHGPRLLLRAPGVLERFCLIWLTPGISPSGPRGAKRLTRGSSVCPEASAIRPWPLLGVEHE